ncbi:hypothetical protein EDB82DRAFT_573711 [Fusarium venenatum]|uniref:uncharacterized protein n=1 Tax=Fusarium venenatum TaxID=56646 RepID=UPI001D7A5973|nr:hypothetical protein EDB82DRAFT_573711 [Fusarium venenatum]
MSQGHPTPFLDLSKRISAISRFEQVLTYFENNNDDINIGYYDKVKLVKFTYEYACNQSSRDLIVLVALCRMGIIDSDDYHVNLDDACLRDTLKAGLYRFANNLLQNFFLPLKALAGEKARPSSPRVLDNHSGSRKCMNRALLNMIHHGLLKTITDGDIEGPKNALTLRTSLRDAFKRFRIFFDPVEDKEDTYVIKAFPPGIPGLPVTRNLSSFNGGNDDLPDPRLLAAHRDIGHILYLSATRPLVGGEAQADEFTEGNSPGLKHEGTDMFGHTWVKLRPVRVKI